MVYRSYRDQVLAAIKEGKDRALEKIGLYVEGEASLRCTVDTGNLKSSLNHKVNVDESKVTIGTNVEYAVYVEKGTSRQAAQPYLTPAAEDNIDTIKRIVKEEMPE